MTKIPDKNQHGFTLIELLVVIGVLAILMAITIIAINPVQQFASARNSQRQADVTSILDAIYAYEAGNNGQLPTPLQTLTTAKPLSSGASNIDLCSYLTPTYIADLPKDPSSTVSSVTGGSTPCSTGTTGYVTGYTIAKSASGNRFTVAASGAENGVTISVTR